MQKGDVDHLDGRFRRRAQGCGSSFISSSPEGRQPQRKIQSASTSTV
jgi:hypothetical protein